MELFFANNLRFDNTKSNLTPLNPNNPKVSLVT